jgi:phage recombination protein Bet
MAQETLPVKHNSEPQEEITRDKIVKYLEAFGMAENLSPNEKEQFIEIAAAYQLNPFKREIYCVPYGKGEKRRLSIITGYETYLKRAERVGSLNGWRVWTEGVLEKRTFTKTIHYRDKTTGEEKEFNKQIEGWGGELKAIIEIHRRDWDKPFTHEVHFDEYNQDNEMWASKPRTMIKKVAVAQGFRMAFPEELGRMPYTSDELSDDMTTVKEGEYIPPAGKTESPAQKKTEPPKAETTPPPKNEINKIDEFKRDTEAAIKNNRTQDLMRLMNSARATLGGPDFAQLAKHVNSLTKKGA